MSKKIFIGCGGAGNVILNTITTQTKLVEEPKIQNFFYNTTSSDLLSSFEGKKLILGADGTGRSKEVGTKIVKQNIRIILDSIENFYSRNVRDLKDSEPLDIVIISSFGGGTGSSVVPVIIDFLYEIKKENSKISFFGIFSSIDEGVSTIPNCVRSFKEVYNSLVMSDKLNNFLVFDNKKLQEDYDFGPFEYEKMNQVIIDYIEKILNFNVDLKVNSGGLQALDLNERRRVMNWGKGVADFCYFPLKKIDEEFEFTSSIFSGRFNLKTAKAVSLRILFKSKREETSEQDIDYANELIAKMRKIFSNAFFVFGFFFNVNQEVPVSLSFYLNGLDFPKIIETDAKKGKKAVSKLTSKNHTIEIEDKDLEF